MAANSTGINVTQGLQSWQLQRSHIERPMDSAAYEAAHPDDTLVLAGPARMQTATGSPTTSTTQQVGTAEVNSANVGSLLAIGMLQSVTITQSKPTQPMMAIGSGRSFFVSGKAQTQWSIARLFINGRNLLRVLAHNFVVNGGDASAFDDPAATSKNSAFFINLDSELFYVPFGLGILFRDKVHNMLGSMYIELAMINSHAIGITAGQNAILENVSGLADRVLPWNNVTDSVSAPGNSQATLDQVLDFTQDAGYTGTSQTTVSDDSVS